MITLVKYSFGVILLFDTLLLFDTNFGNQVLAAGLNTIVIFSMQIIISLLKMPHLQLLPNV